MRPTSIDSRRPLPRNRSRSQAVLRARLAMTDAEIAVIEAQNHLRATRLALIAALEHERAELLTEMRAVGQPERRVAA